MDRKCARVIRLRGARQTWPDRLRELLSRDLAESEAREHGRAIEAHHRALTDQLGRDPGIDLAVCDYLRNVIDAAPDLRLVTEEALAGLRALASTDALTGLLNRRGLEPLVRREQARAERREEALALLLIDVDHFKRVNDRFGHRVGDAVLRRLAAVLVRVSRASDLVARFGGDEFVVLLPATDRRGAESLAERIRHAVASEDFLENGERVTVSIGVTVVQGEEHAEPVALADLALYRAKRAGRDRVASS